MQCELHNQAPVLIVVTLVASCQLPQKLDSNKPLQNKICQTVENCSICFNDIVAPHFSLPWIAEIAHCMKAVHNFWIDGLYSDCENEK
jgi:hypothetical protein